MKDMTKIKDKSKTIKTEEMGAQWKEILTAKWQLDTRINKVDERITSLVVSKCRGNPLLCLEYFVNLLHNDCIHIDKIDGTVSPGTKFETYMELDDWTGVPIPRLAFKINTTMLDQYYW